MGLLRRNWTLQPDRSSGFKDSSLIICHSQKPGTGRANLFSWDLLVLNLTVKCWLMEDQKQNKTNQNEALVECAISMTVITVFQHQWITLSAVHLLFVPCVVRDVAL